MASKLYIGNLPFSTTEDVLKDLFSKSGTVESVKIIVDQATGRSKGFAFIEMSTEEEANAAVSSMNGIELEGRKIKVDIARPKENSGRFSGPRRDFNK